MCGIAAGSGNVRPDMIQTMLSLQAHRGPDGEGLFVAPDGRAVLGHRRLAIIDVECGRQPLVADGGDAALITNGMIYNFGQVQEALPPAVAETRSDAESVLRLYRSYASRGIERLDGMFAVVLRDGAEGSLLSARDPVGIKPLYRLQADDHELFASEIKALLPFAGQIEEFPAGHLRDPRTGTMQRYYEVPGERIRWRDSKTSARVVRSSLEHAVEKRLQSDVPLGAFLSGGLDSSVIAALARRHCSELHTFSAGVAGSADLEAARHVADHLGTVHHEHVITPADVAEALPRILWHLESFDLDLVRSAVPCWFVSRLAAEHVKVVLTGEGADELFAGYTYMRGIADDRALHGELRRSVASLHNLNLQRVDRMTMAHGLEARVPFLDVEMIETALTVDPALKRRDGREKWILRKACADLLPSEIVWRKKAQFDQGSGLDALLTSLTPGNATPSREIEEAWYRDTLAAQFDNPDRLLNLVGHWQGTLVQ